MPIKIIKSFIFLKLTLDKCFKKELGSIFAYYRSTKKDWKIGQKGLGFHIMVEHLLGKAMDSRMTEIPRTMQDEKDPPFTIKGNPIDYMYISKEEQFSNREKIVTEAPR